MKKNKYKYVKNPDYYFKSTVKNIFDNENLFGSEQSIYQINYLIKFLKLNKNSIFIDLGSHKGEEISELLKCECQIHAFEPNPFLFKFLKEKFKNNKKVILKDFAASVRNGYENFYFHSKNFKVDSGSLVANENLILTNNFFKRFILKNYYRFFYDRINKIKCKSLDISEYILSLKTEVDVLKIDTEGTEYEILNHLFDTGTYKKIKFIFYEDHIRRFNNNENELITSYNIKWFDLRKKCLKKYFKENYLLYEF